MTDLAILMYHRVCDRTPATEPYFVRGTAVRPEVFAAQLHWLHGHCEVISLASWAAGDHDARTSRQPLVAITFDDGFVECATAVAPTMASLQMPLSVFPSAAFHGDGVATAWTDHYYAILAARQHRPANLGWLLGPEEAVPEADQGLRWWVHGPPKAALFALNVDERAEALERLAFECGCPAIGDDLARRLYCTLGQLRELVAAGVSVGGHGATHQRLSDLSPARRDAELVESARLLDELGVGSPRLLCYPDGAHDAGVRAAAGRFGFDVGLMVEAGFASRTADPLQLPRFIARDLEPDRVGWCAAFPETTAAGVAMDVNP